jgi:putative hydrolase
MTPAQRESFGRTQALMSLLEGASNHVMNAVGSRVLPDFDALHEKFEGRHRRRGPLEQLVLRLTGLDLKLEQYAEGERFVAAVVAQSGQAGLARVWRGPEWLPTLDDPRSCGLAGALTPWTLTIWRSTPEARAGPARSDSHRWSAGHR